MACTIGIRKRFNDRLSCTPVSALPSKHDEITDLA